jgi:hypothetical protein
MRKNLHGSPYSFFVLFLALTFFAGPLALDASAAYPTSCYDVVITSGGGDGEYTIAPTPDQVFSVYCYSMATGRPKEYLTLANTGGSYNFSQFTPGGAWPNTTIRTTYNKIRIDPTTLLVDIDDTTFATSTLTGPPVSGSPNQWIAYGVAADCAGISAHTGIANIDLTGTPFVVYDRFFIDGFYPGGTAVVDGQPLSITSGGGATPAGSWFFVAGKTVDLTGGGYAGAIGPQGYNSIFPTWVQEAEPQSILALNLKYKTPPTTTAVYSGTLGANGIYVSNVTVAITATDLIAVKEIHYIVDGTETVVPGTAVNVLLSTNGAHTFSYFAVDTYGNAEPAHPATVTIDMTAPTVSSTSPANRATGVIRSSSITVTFSETVAAGSAYSGITLKKGNTAVSSTNTLSGNTLTIKPSSSMSSSTAYTITIPGGAVVDTAGNNSATYSSSFTTGTK